MSDNKIIGIVGQGFVGGSINEGLKDYLQVETYDKYIKSKSTCNSLKSLVEKSGLIFVCLPTPMKKTGECDVSIIDGVLSEINDMNLERIVIIKSTVPPGMTRNFAEKYSNIRIVFNPEFLKEKTAVEDFKNQNRIILGGDVKYTSIVAMMYMQIFQPPEVKYIHTSYEVAEMTKYMTNTFLSTVISYANEIYGICEGLGIDYDEVRQCSIYDERLAKAPLIVPCGNDMGWGGHCFPKDLNSLMFVARGLGIDIDVLEASWKTNLRVRENKDWEQMKGRAVAIEDELSDLEYFRKNLFKSLNIPEKYLVETEEEQ